MVVVGDGVFATPIGHMFEGYTRSIDIADIPLPTVTALGLLLAMGRGSTVPRFVLVGGISVACRLIIV